MEIQLIGCPLDPDEREAFIVRKIESCMKDHEGLAFRDPMDGLLAGLPAFQGKSKTIGIEPWLLPAPPNEMLFMLTVENFVTFIDSDGCLEYANKVKEAVRSSIPKTPVLVGVDHSLSGGAIKALAEEHGGENIRLIGLTHLSISGSDRVGVTIVREMPGNSRCADDRSNRVLTTGISRT